MPKPGLRRNTARRGETAFRRKLRRIPLLRPKSAGCGGLCELNCQLCELNCQRTTCGARRRPLAGRGPAWPRRASLFKRIQYHISASGGSSLLSHFPARRGIFRPAPLDSRGRATAEGTAKPRRGPGPRDLFRNNRGGAVLPSMVPPWSLWAPCLQFFQVWPLLPLPLAAIAAAEGVAGDVLGHQIVESPKPGRPSPTALPAVRAGALVNNSQILQFLRRAVCIPRPPAFPGLVLVLLDLVVVDATARCPGLLFRDL
jgi:hypothetical protein